jgi:hypothetical protein
MQSHLCPSRGIARMTVAGPVDGMKKRQAARVSRNDAEAEGKDRIAVGGSCARTLALGSGRGHHHQGDNCHPLCRADGSRCGVMSCRARDFVVMVRSAREGAKWGFMMSSRAVALTKCEGATIGCRCRKNRGSVAGSVHHSRAKAEAWRHCHIEHRFVYTYQPTLTILTYILVLLNTDTGR